MKKFTLILVTAAIGICVVFFCSNFVFAEYRDSVKKEVGEEIVKFYNTENGNRITSYNIPTLLNNINNIFDKNFVKPVPPQVEKKENIPTEKQESK